MQLIAPVTDYIPASILTTLGDLPIRGAAIPQRLAGGAEDLHLKGQGIGALPIYEALRLIDTGIHTEQFSTFASETVVLSGFGFRPSIIIAIAWENSVTKHNWSIGWDFITLPAWCFYVFKDGVEQSYSAELFHIEQPDADDIVGDLDSLDADGCTIDVIETGAVSISVRILALP